MVPNSITHSIINLKFWPFVVEVSLIIGFPQNLWKWVLSGRGQGKGETTEYKELYCVTKVSSEMALFIFHRYKFQVNKLPSLHAK